jgi:hypothetical protein
MLVIAQQAEENDRQHKATGGDDVGHMPKHKAADCTDNTPDERATRETRQEPRTERTRAVSGFWVDSTAAYFVRGSSDAFDSSMNCEE